MTIFREKKNKFGFIAFYQNEESHNMEMPHITLNSINIWKAYPLVHILSCLNWSTSYMQNMFWKCSLLNLYPLFFFFINTMPKYRLILGRQKTTQFTTVAPYLIIKNVKCLLLREHIQMPCLASKISNPTVLQTYLFFSFFIITLLYMWSLTVVFYVHLYILILNLKYQWTVLEWKKLN